MSGSTTSPVAPVPGSGKNDLGVGNGPSRVLECVGDTPLLELTRIARDVAPVRICAKAEMHNPGGSVKDRPALNMILDGRRSGRLTPEKTILDATSGNTGIAYAMIGAALGYRVKLVMPRSAGAMHQRILRAYGAQLDLTPAPEGNDGTIRRAIQLNEQDPDRYFYPDQYNNDANWKAHYDGTALEILRQTGGELTHFVAGLGTSGTFTGNGRRFREHNERIGLISFQPDSPMNGLEGLKHMPTSIKPGFYDESMADENLFIRTEDAQAMVKRLALEEGVLVGTSAGAAVVAALQVASRLSSGLVVTVLPDGAAKYLDHAYWVDP